MSEREELACPVCRVTMLPDDGDARGMFPSPPHSQCPNCGTIVPKKAADDYLRQPHAPVQVTDEIVERICAAIFPGWHRFKERSRTIKRNRLEAALQAGVPSGWKLAPRIATPEMCIVGATADNGNDPMQSAWQAMYDAAPAPGEGMCACGAMTAQACNDLPSLRHCRGAQATGEGSTAGMRYLSEMKDSE